MSVFHVRQRRAAAIKLTDSRQKDHTEGVPPLTAAKREVAYASVVNVTAFNTLSSYIGFGGALTYEQGSSARCHPLGPATDYHHVRISRLVISWSICTPYRG